MTLFASWSAAAFRFAVTVLAKTATSARCRQQRSTMRTVSLGRAVTSMSDSDCGSERHTALAAVATLEAPPQTSTRTEALREGTSLWHDVELHAEPLSAGL